MHLYELGSMVLDAKNDGDLSMVRMSEWFHTSDLYG